VSGQGALRHEDGAAARNSPSFAFARSMDFTGQASFAETLSSSAIHTKMNLVADDLLL
jgi:hypothetical protein